MRAISIAAMTTLLAIGAETGEGQRDLKAAMNVELVDGDLRTAIRRYSDIIAKYKTNRPLTAKALVQMAECYQKMGDAEATRIYEKVVREYSDQKHAAAEARARLGEATPVQTRPTSTLVWSGSKVSGEGTISPDGRYISGVDWDTGDLILHDNSTGVTRNLTNKGSWKESEDFAEESAISRDGKQIAFAWFDSKKNHAELRLANVAGEFKSRTLYDNPELDWIYVYDWSPDNKWLAVVASRKDHTKQIGLVSVETGSLRTLKSVGWRGADRMFFSPDGKYLGYDSAENDTNSQHAVFVLAVDGSRELRAAPHHSTNVMMGWSVDGTWLLFASDRTGATGLWGVPFENGEIRGTPQLLRSDLPGRAEPLGITRSGALFYATGLGGSRSRVFTVPFDFATARFLAAPMDISRDPGESNRAPIWSPDGKRLAYSIERGSARERELVLAIRSMDSQRVRELHPKLRYFDDMRWSPDGRSFVALGRDLLGRRGLFLINSDSAEVSTVFIDPNGQQTGYPAWAPDGKSLYFPRDYDMTKDKALIQRDLATGHEREVIRGAYVGGLSVSPDGKYLTTASADPASNSRILLLIPVTGGKPRELMRVASGMSPDKMWLTTEGTFFGVPCWAPNSKSLLVWKKQSPDTQKSELWQVPLDGGPPRKLDAPALAVSSNLPLIASPDGTRLAFRVTEKTPKNAGEVWALEHFLPVRSARK